MSAKGTNRAVANQIVLPLFRGLIDGSELEDEVSSRPFIKWAGGKSRLLPELLKRLPAKYNTYFEPFLGGGALFFAVRPKKAVLIDINSELVNAYSVVKSQVKDLVRELKKHPYTAEYFYGLRNKDRDPRFKRWSAVRRAGRLIYLNKTCYNGLYRVNSDGKFNVPFGRYNRPKIVDPENLTACSDALKHAEILQGSYELIEKRVRKNDFVYFDPPFVPLNQTSNFTSYTKEGFSDLDQTKLRDLCIRLDKKGVRFMLSNSTSEKVLDLYSNFNIERIMAGRAINSKGDRRGKIEEVIVRNYC